MKTKKLTLVTQLLIVLLGLSIPFGELLNEIIGLKTTFIFHIISVFIIGITFYIKKESFKFLPKFYFIFIAYILVHTLLFYFFKENYSVSAENIFKNLIFLFLPIALAFNFNEKKHLTYFTLALNFSFFIAFAFTIFHLNVESDNNDALRVTGFYTSATSFWALGLSVAFLNLILFVENEIRHIKSIAIFMLLLGITAATYTLSRGVILAYIVACIVVITLLRGKKNKLVALAAGCIIVVFNYIIIPQQLMDMFLDRSNISQRIEKNNEPRTKIWEAYILEYKDYILLGNGLSNSSYAIRNNNLVRPTYMPHNRYIQLVAEHGIAALLLFLTFIFFTIKTIYNNHYRHHESMYPFAVFFIVWCSILFINDFVNLASHMLFISIAILIHLRFKLRKSNV